MAKKRAYTTANNYITNDATYRAFWVALDSMLLALGGVTAVPQTGEFNLATGLAPAAVTSARAWRMYALKDNNTAGLPNYYIKLSVGRSEFSTGGILGFRVDFGNAVDGSGNMTGATLSYAFANRRTNMNGTSTAFLLNVYGQSDEQNITTFLFHDTSLAASTPPDTNILISWGRTRDPLTGATDGRGLNFVSAGGGPGAPGSSHSQCEICLGTNCQVFYKEEKLLVPVVGGGNIAPHWVPSSNESTTFVFPVVEAYAVDCPAMHLATYFLADMPKPLAQKSINLWGVTRNYLFTGQLASQTLMDTQNCLGGNQQRWGVCMPWEGTDV